MDDRFLLEEEPQRKSQVGMWVVAGCLVAVLVTYHSWGGEEEENKKSAPQKTVAAAPNATPEMTTKVRERSPINWPAISFAELAKNNPFQPQRDLENIIRGTPEDRAEVQAVERELEGSREAKRKQQARLRDLSSSDWKVRLLFESAQGAAAVIGDRVVREGDELDGYQVVTINRDGVILEPLKDAGSASSDGD